MEKIKLREIAQKSVFGSVGTLLNRGDLANFISFVQYNLVVLKNFAEVMYSLNGNADLIGQSSEILQKILEKKVHVITTENLGHTFGTFMNDRNVITYADNFSCEYIWKFSNDVVVNESILDKYVAANKDFYYINNIGYAASDKYTKNQLLQAIMDQAYFYPQTNYYIIKNHINFYPDIDLILELKNRYDSIRANNPSIQPWHAIEGCDCETMLVKTIEKNNLSKQYLLSETNTKDIIEFIYANQIYDGSHKNISYTELGNLCHLHFPNHVSYQI